MPQEAQSDRLDRRAGVEGQLSIALGFGVAYVALAAPALWWSSKSPEVILPAVLLATVLVVLSVIDIRHFRLPDALTLPLAVAGLACSGLLHWDDMYWRLAATCVGFGLLAGIGWLYHRLRGRHGLGLGDAKLFAAAGAWHGIEGLPATLLVASLGATIFIVLRSFAGHEMQPNTRIAFGPFLAGGLWLTWLYGPFI